MTINNYLG